MNTRPKARKRSAASGEDRLRSPEQRRLIIIAATGTAALVFAVGLMTALSWLLSAPPPANVSPASPTVTAQPPAAVPRVKRTLFFASEDGQRLVASEQDVPIAEGVVAQARALLEAQFSAEPPAPLVSTIPKGATLRGFFVSGRGEAFVDLDPSIKKAHPGGSLQELMTVYTIVNTLLTNLPDLQEVQILIGGQEVDTLAGHVDLRRPLRKNEGLTLPPGPPQPQSTQ